MSDVMNLGEKKREDQPIMNILSFSLPYGNWLEDAFNVVFLKQMCEAALTSSLSFCKLYIVR